MRELTGQERFLIQTWDNCQMNGTNIEKEKDVNIPLEALEKLVAQVIERTHATDLVSYVDYDKDPDCNYYAKMH